MATRNWTNTGFWVVLGLAGGMLISNLTRPASLEAVSSCVSSETTLMATGGSNNELVELVWILDEKGRLVCMLFGQNGQLLMRPSLDMKELLQPKGKKPKFCMVTGRFKIGAQQVDALYVTETSTNRMVAISPDPRLGRLVPFYNNIIRDQ